MRQHAFCRAHASAHHVPLRWLVCAVFLATFAACGVPLDAPPIPEPSPDRGVVAPVVLFGTKDERHVSVGVLLTRFVNGTVGACSATVIGPRVALTAAHCVVLLDPDALEERRFVLHHATEVYFFPVGPQATHDPGGTVVRGTAVPHPRFLHEMRAIEEDPESITPERYREILADLFLRNDIALVILHEQASFGDNPGAAPIFPTPVAHPTYPALAGLSPGLQWNGLPITIVGFGSGTAENFGTRRRANNHIRYVGQENFQAYLSAWAQRGDSGGPVLFEQDSGGVPVVLGVISKGMALVFDLYQRVDAYLPWILETVGSYRLQIAVASDSGVSLAP